MESSQVEGKCKLPGMVETVLWIDKELDFLDASGVTVNKRLKKRFILKGLASGINYKSGFQQNDFFADICISMTIWTSRRSSRTSGSNMIHKEMPTWESTTTHSSLVTILLLHKSIRDQREISARLIESVSTRRKKRRSASLEIGLALKS